MQALYLCPCAYYYPRPLKPRLIPLANLLRKPISEMEAWYAAFQTHTTIGNIRKDNNMVVLEASWQSYDGLSSLAPMGRIMMVRIIVGIFLEIFVGIFVGIMSES